MTKSMNKVLQALDFARSKATNIVIITQTANLSTVSSVGSWEYSVVQCLWPWP